MLVGLGTRTPTVTASECHQSKGQAMWLQAQLLTSLVCCAAAVLSTASKRWPVYGGCLQTVSGCCGRSTIARHAYPLCPTVDHEC